MELLIGIGIFFTTVLFIESAYAVAHTVKQRGRSRARKRLQTLSAGGYVSEETDIIRKRLLSEVPWLHSLLLKIPRMLNLDRFLEQANVGFPIGVFVLLTVCLPVCTYAGLSFLKIDRVTVISTACLVAFLPFFFVYWQKKKRMEKFEKQLPDALDLVARSLRAGHALSGGLKMVSDEFDDPIGTEFDKTMDQVSFGIALPDALINLAERIDSEDLRFFVISVIIQRETGGNLAEILEKIGLLIRQRFELRGRVKALSAEGRLSAVILALLPFIVGFYLSIVSPAYIGLLFTDSTGKIMVLFVVCMMVVGIFLMKRIVNIKV